MGCSISIIVPNFNGERYLRECLDSIAAQGNERTSVLFMDGGSTDASCAIAESYGQLIGYLVSERDRGQSDAINKGLRLATGDLVAYLNSDDVLEPGSLAKVQQFFEANPEADWLSGGCRVFGEGLEPWFLHPEGWSQLLDTVLPWDRPQKYVFPQSGACFMRRCLTTQLGAYDENLHYSMDMEYYARAAFAGARMHIISDVLAGWRWHPAAKSWTRGCAYAFRRDEIQILRRYLDRLPPEQRSKADNLLRKQDALVAVSEANYWRAEGQRWRSARLLVDAVRKSPWLLLERPWLGAVRRTTIG